MKNTQEELSIFKGKEPHKDVEKYSVDKKPAPTPLSTMEDLYEYVSTHYKFMVTSEDNLYVYNEKFGYWKLLPDIDSNRTLRRLLPQGFMAKVTKSVLYELREWLSVYSRLVSTEDLKKSRNYINFRDAAYNVKDDKATTDRKSLYFRYSLDIDYCNCKEESSGVFEKFVMEALNNDQDTIKEFRKFFALCLSNTRGIRQSAFFLYGPSGTGKSTILRVLRHIVGHEHICSISFSQLSNEFAVATLHGKHLVLSSEISDIGNKKLDVFKSLTGDDLISTSFKGKDHFSLENRAIFVFATNVMPEIINNAETEAIISRMVIFPFTHIVDKSDTKAEFWLDLLKDKSGIVNFAIQGFKDLRKDNFRFNDSVRMAEFKRSFAEENDSFSLFLKEHVITEPDSFATSADIDSAYRLFCLNNEIAPMASKKWSPILMRKFACFKTHVQPPNGKRGRGYKGIKLTKQSLKMIGCDASVPEKTLQEIIFGSDDEEFEAKNPELQEYSSEDFLEEINKAYKTDDNEYSDSEEE